MAQEISEDVFKFEKTLTELQPHEQPFYNLHLLHLTWPQAVVRFKLSV